MQSLLRSQAEAYSAGVKVLKIYLWSSTVFTTDVQNMIFQSLAICPNLSELSREEQKAQMWEKRHYPDECHVPALELESTKLFKEKATTLFQYQHLFSLFS